MAWVFRRLSFDTIMSLSFRRCRLQFAANERVLAINLNATVYFPDILLNQNTGNIKPFTNTRSLTLIPLLPRVIPIKNNYNKISKYFVH